MTAGPTGWDVGPGGRQTPGGVLRVPEGAQSRQVGLLDGQDRIGRKRGHQGGDRGIALTDIESTFANLHPERLRVGRGLA